jgi:hypothetical protein
MSVIASERSERGNLRDHFAALVMTDTALVMTGALPGLQPPP